jgi:hypothetical protein
MITSAADLITKLERFTSIARAAACGAALLMTAPATAAADGVPIKVDEATIAEELKAPEDPTIVKRRVWVDTEGNHFKHGGDDLDFTFGGIWSWAASPRQDWAVRLKVPIRTHFAGDNADDRDKQGIGDVKLAAGGAVRLSNVWRAGGGLEMRFPTASDNLGANAWRPQLFGALAWDVTPRITLSPSAEYNKSIAETRGAARQEFLELFFPVTFIRPGRWSITPRYEMKIDFAKNDRLTQSAKLSATKQLDNSPLGLTLSIKKPFDGGDKKVQVNFVTTYYFR